MEVEAGTTVGAPWLTTLGPTGARGGGGRVAVCAGRSPGAALDASPGQLLGLFLNLFQLRGTGLYACRLWRQHG